MRRLFNAHEREYRSVKANEAFLKPRFYDEYGPAITLPVNAIAYQLSDGGDLVRGKPHTFEALKSHVWEKYQSYGDLNPLTRLEVNRKMDRWLEANEH